jgi:hypothetical protein
MIPVGGGRLTDAAVQSGCLTYTRISSLCSLRQDRPARVNDFHTKIPGFYHKVGRYKFFLGRRCVLLISACLWSGRSRGDVRTVQVRRRGEITPATVLAPIVSFQGRKEVRKR